MIKVDEDSVTDVESALAAYLAAKTKADEAAEDYDVATMRAKACAVSVAEALAESLANAARIGAKSKRKARK